MRKNTFPTANNDLINILRYKHQGITDRFNSHNNKASTLLVSSMLLIITSHFLGILNLFLLFGLLIQISLALYALWPAKMTDIIAISDELKYLNKSRENLIIQDRLNYIEGLLLESIVKDQGIVNYKGDALLIAYQEFAFNIILFLISYGVVFFT